MTREATAHRLRYQFLERHRDADWLVFDARTHQAIGAVYYAPDWYETPEVHRKGLRDFFSLVQRIDQEWVSGS